MAKMHTYNIFYIAAPINEASPWVTKINIVTHFSMDFYNIGIYGKLTTRPISLDMYCKPQYKIIKLFTNYT